MENGQGEKFCLRWNDFEKNISTSLKHLHDDKDFFDVTLVCENNQIQAHKLILSACSSFFRSVLKQNPHQHPLLYLKGVRYEDITSVLNFMYHGEVSVAQEELNTFLAVAEDLKVKGLYQHDQTKHPKDYLEPKETKPLPSERTHKQKGSTADYQEINRRPISLPRETHNPQPEIKIEASVNVGDEEEEENHSVVRTDYYDNTGYEEEQYQQDYEEQAQYETVALNQSPGKVFSAGWSSVPKPYPCPYCSKEFANPQSLCKHKKSHTGQTYCDTCDKNFSTVPNLRAHMNTVHSSS